MSTTPTPVAPPAPVPAEQVNVNMPKEQIAAAVPTPAAAPVPVPVAEVAPTPDNPVVTKDLGNGQYEVKYLTGETFKGTASEILIKQGQSNFNTKMWAKDEIAKAKQPPTPEPAKTSLFATPEEEATAKYVTELQAKALGFPNAESYQEALSRVQQNTEQFAGQNLSIQFAAAAPEFNATPENSEKLLNVVDQLGLTQQFVNGQTDQQLNILRAAHAFALQTKVYEPRPEKTQTAPVTPPVPPPPIPSSGPVDLSTVPDDLKVDVNMTKEEIQRRIDLARQRNYIY